MRFYNKRGTAEQWIKASDALDAARPSGRTMRLQLACWHNLGNLAAARAWSLTSLQHRLMKTGGRLVKHARYYWLLLADGHLNRKLFGDMLGRIWALPVPGG